jgi:hypothetical protein
MGLVTVSLVALLSGCGHRQFLPATFVASVALNTAILTSGPRIVLVNDGLSLAPPPAPVLVAIPAPVPPPPRSIAGFDATQARAALESVDGSSCWMDGAGPGYATVRVTWNPDGHVQLVEVVGPHRGAAVDATCMSTRYGTLSLPPFAGEAVAVSASFYVK